ncbi:polyketide synthase, partial [Streptomyces ossamyceticus]|nr:polyketide synthase [Streptomyces ossamyceticus]
SALAALWTSGAEIDWSRVLPQNRRVRVPLPTYAFQRDRYWPKAAVTSTLAAADPDEARFWKAIENQDLGELAEALDIAETPDALGSVLPVLSSWRQLRRRESVIGSWRYRVTWKPLSGLPEARLSGRWLVVVPGVVGSVAVVGQVEAAIRSAGGDVVRCVLDGVDREVWAARLAEVGPVVGVVSLLALAEGPYVSGSVVSGGVAGSLVLLQALGDV